MSDLPMRIRSCTLVHAFSRWLIHLQTHDPGLIRSWMWSITIRWLGLARWKSSSVMDQTATVMRQLGPDHVVNQRPRLVIQLAWLKGSQQVFDGADGGIGQ